MGEVGPSQRNVEFDLFERFANGHDAYGASLGRLTRLWDTVQRRQNELKVSKARVAQVQAFKNDDVCIQPPVYSDFDCETPVQCACHRTARIEFRS